MGTKRLPASLPFPLICCWSFFNHILIFFWGIINCSERPLTGLIFLDGNSKDKSIPPPSIIYTLPCFTKMRQNDSQPLWSLLLTNPASQCQIQYNPSFLFSFFLNTSCHVITMATMKQSPWPVNKGRSLALYQQVFPQSKMLHAARRQMQPAWMGETPIAGGAKTRRPPACPHLWRVAGQQPSCRHLGRSP